MTPSSPPSATARSSLVAINDNVGASTGDSAWLAIRPEKVRISLDAPAETGRNCLSGEVWDIGYLGDMSIYHVLLDSGHVVKSAQSNASRLVQRPITWEDKVYLTWPAEAAIVLTA